MIGSEPEVRDAPPQVHEEGKVSRYLGKEILRGSKMRIAYGDLTAVRDAEIALSEGECLLLSGPNGAGKSTLCWALAGVFRLKEGEIKFFGEDITRRGASERVKMGISLVPEGKRIFKNRTVRENLILGAIGAKAGRNVWKNDYEQWVEEFAVLRTNINKRAGLLSGGQQQILAIVTAMMASPKVLIVDEPSAGLAPEMVSQVEDVLRRVMLLGVAILIVEESDRLFKSLYNAVQLMDEGHTAIH